MPWQLIVMQLGDVIKYLRSMSLSILMMLLLTYGMATKSPLLNPTYIILIVLALQFGYQMVKSTRSRGKVEANVQDAARVKRGVPLFAASEKDVKKAKEDSKGPNEMSMGMKMMVMLLAPLVIFIGSGYLLSMLIPGIEQWQSYMIGFILSMSVSTVLTFRMKALPGAAAITPNAYTINERGIAFDHMSQAFIVRFPLTKLNVQKEKNFIEAEGKAEAPVIPNKLRLFTDKIDQLEKLLTKHVTSQETRDAHKTGIA